MHQRGQIFIQNGYYHIYNRGHNKQPIFLDHKDYIRYLNRLKEYLHKPPVTILVYCLMPNHIHLLIRQDTEESVERFIHRLHTAYTMYFNKKYERVGSVFQGRFKARLITSDEYLLHVSRYIHQNPIDILQPQGQALNLQLIKYPWSSYNKYTTYVNNPLVNIDIILDYFTTTYCKDKKMKKKAYKQFVEDTLPKKNSSQLEKTNNGDF